MQTLHQIRKACTLLDVSPGDATSPLCFETNLQAKYSDLVQKYESTMFDGPEEIRKKSLSIIHSAYETLIAHQKVVVYVMTTSKFRENQTHLPVQHSFSRQFIRDAVTIVQNERCIWKPTVDHMRCFRWCDLIGAIKRLQPNEVKQFLIANPYLSTQSSSLEKNPYLQTTEVSHDMLAAGRLTTYDLVNIDNGETDALSEVYNTLSCSVHEKDVEDCLKRAEQIHALLVSHGAVARFAKKVALN